jgi:glycosyltransferase involved in cell wall biosynthesis
MLPESIEPFCIFQQIEENNPEFSIVIPIHNQENIIRHNLDAILHYTKGLYELILILDACSDKSEEVIRSWISSAFPTNCVGCTVFKSITPMFETAADNYGFRKSRGKYCLEIQADMEMTEDGYNLQLKRPFEVNSNVIGVSGRCSHKFDGTACIGRGGYAIELPLDPSLNRNMFYINETCNRGPLLLDREKLMKLNFLDEENFYLDNSDHDLFARAWVEHKWICGYIPIDFKSPLMNGSTRKKRDALNTFYLNIRREKSNGGFLKKYMMNYQPRETSIITLPSSTK